MNDVPLRRQISIIDERFGGCYEKSSSAVIVLAHLFTASCGYKLINNDDDGELDIILSLNAPNDDIVLVDYAFIHGLGGYADAYIKEGE
jgi:hypothetical protein